MGNPGGNQTSDSQTYPRITINKKVSNERPSQHQTQTGNIDPQIMAIRTTATPWNWMLPGNEQGSTSQEKNSKAGFANNHASNAHNLDT